MDGNGKAQGAVQDIPETNEIASIATIFANPQRTFAGMAEKPRFWVAIIVTVVVMALLSVLVFQSGVVAEQTIAKLEAEGAPQAQIDATAQMFESPIGLVMALVGNVLAVPFALLVSAGLLFFMGNLLLGAKLRFPHYLSAVVYGSVVGLVDHVIRTALVMSKGSLDIRLGLGNLFGEELNYAARILDSMTDPFLLWGMAVTAIGVAAYARKGFGFGVIATLPVFVVTLLLSGMR